LKTWVVGGGGGGGPAPLILGKEKQEMTEGRKAGSPPSRLVQGLDLALEMQEKLQVGWLRGWAR